MFIITLVFLATALLSFGVAGYLFWRVRNTSVTANWAMIIMVFNGATAITNLLAATAPTPFASHNWLVITTVLTVLGPVQTLLFVARLTNKDNWFNSFYGPILMTLPTLIFLCLIPTNLLINFNKLHGITYAPAGAPGPLYNIFVLYFLGLVITILTILIRYYRKLREPIKKHEIALIIGGWVGIIIASAIYQGPMQNIFHMPYFPINLTFTALNGIVIAYALTKYGLAVFNPNDVAAHIVEAVPGVMMILDHSGTVIYANAATERTLGYKTSMLVGGSVGKLFANDAVYQRFQQSIADPLIQRKSDQSQLEDVTLQTQDGKATPVNISATCSRDNHGNVVNIIVVCIGIDQLKHAQAALEEAKASVERKVEERTHELREEQGRLSSSIESLPLGLMVVDVKNEIIVRNQAMNTILGYQNSSWNLSQLAKDLKQMVDVTAQCAEVQRTQTASEVMEFSFGAKILSLAFYPVFADKKVIGTILLLGDITEARVLERSKDEFFSIASHELRTPLTAIKGNSSLMLQYYADALKDPTLHEMTQDIQTSSIRLIEIVNDFLDMSRLEQGKIEFKIQPVALDETIKQVVYEMGPVIDQKHLEVHLDTAKQAGLQVMADPDRTKQILYNLVGNAAKFTEKGSITISAHRDGKFVKVLVTDTGRGIPVEARKLLFRKFQQAGDSLLTRDTARGTGLGLYISKSLAQGMGGDVELQESTPGKGSAFCLTIPLAASTQAPATQQDSATAKPAKLIAKQAQHILAFEDDPYVQRLYKRLFKLENYQLELANNGEGGVEKAASVRPSLILLDLMMPKVDGMTLLKELKKDMRTKDIPVLVITNVANTNTIEQARGYGIADYLLRPDFTPETLLEEVKKHL